MSQPFRCDVCGRIRNRIKDVFEVSLKYETDCYHLGGPIHERTRHVCIDGDCQSVTVLSLFSGDGPPAYRKAVNRGA